MADIQLKVTPETLKAKAQDVTTSINNIQTQYNSIGNTIKASKGYWLGDASDAHQKQYKSLVEEAEQILKRLKEHPKDLLEMANIYTAAEKEAEAISSSLPDDIII